MTWAISLLGFLVCGAYIVFSTTQEQSGIIMCTFFYSQISAFARFPVEQVMGGGSLATWAAKFTIFESVVSFVSQSCFGTNLEGYSSKVMQLSGPALVMFFAFAITCCLKLAHPLLQRRGHYFSVSYTSLFAQATLVVFTSVAVIVFQLIKCVSVTVDGMAQSVVFIDGTVDCYDNKWKGLLVFSLILAAIPPVIALALHRNAVPAAMRKVLCGSFRDSHYYWSPVLVSAMP
jgi:hypothetical protein